MSKTEILKIISGETDYEMGQVKINPSDIERLTRQNAKLLIVNESLRHQFRILKKNLSWYEKEFARPVAITCQNCKNVYTLEELKKMTFRRCKRCS